LRFAEGKNNALRMLESCRGRKKRGTTSIHPFLTEQAFAGSYHCPSSVTGRTRRRLPSKYAFSGKLQDEFTCGTKCPFSAAGVLCLSWECRILVPDHGFWFSESISQLSRMIIRPERRLVNDIFNF
jgi:hypothetical protein